MRGILFLIDFFIKVIKMYRQIMGLHMLVYIKFKDMFIKNFVCTRWK